jgi:hypothetical protein
VGTLHAGGAPEPAHERGAPALPVEQASPAVQDDLLVQENARLRERLDVLALDLARREGEAQANAWSVAELERRLGQAAAPPSPAPAGGVDSRIAEVLDELDALRQALAQEHSLRVRAESGEELSRARAEIQRQAVLLEQLGHPARPSDTELGAPGK